MAGPEWNDFRVILALGRAGSVSGAARVLGVEGSTVSRRLAAAEQAMEAVLIVRGGRAFAFTEAAETMDAAVGEAAAAVRLTRTDLEGIVRRRRSGSTASTWPAAWSQAAGSVSSTAWSATRPTES